MGRFRILAAIMIAAAMALVACNEEEAFTSDSSARLYFSADTVKFDTVFTQIGSATRRFQIFNGSKDKGIVLPMVRLGSDGKSGFRMNLDGRSGTRFTDVEVLHGDSLFCFVEVTIDPHDSDSPILLTDSILFTLPGGKVQKVMLEAYGQDVIVMHAQHITEDVTLDARRPYLIYDSLVVDSGGVLRLMPGTTLCFHAGSGMKVYGQLTAEGTAAKPVTMRGDRTDRLLSDLPYDLTAGQWEGITLCSQSKPSTLKYCDIHGGNYGIAADGIDSLYVLNTIIHNVTGDGLRFKDCTAKIRGCQISNAGGYCALVIGGNIDFAHCTIAQFYPWSGMHGGALYFANVEEEEEGRDMAHPLTRLTFFNSIITGASKDEIYGTRMADSDAAFNYLFAGCLINTVVDGKDCTADVASHLYMLNESYQFDNDSIHFIACQLDTVGDKAKPSKDDKKVTRPREGNFLFNVEGYEYVFTLDSLSAARQLGIGSITPPDCSVDIKGNARNQERPDAGCYQYVSESEKR